jgi:signal transduction histidine kinase
MLKETQQLDPQLKALSEAARAITSELSLEQVLQKIAQAAQTLINARYAALGVHDGHGNLSRFITAGVEADMRDHIARLPVGRGLLGVFLRAGKSIVVNDISNHPAAVGFPQHHPVMHNLLGVPIYSKGELIGALYLADKKDGSNFTETDQQLIEMLALHAAIALENAHLYEKTQRLAILEERERFARDLHDGIIQSIYAVGLSLDNAKANISSSNEAARSQIDGSLKNLANVINDIRNYIFDLRPHATKSKGLYARLEGLVKELKVNNLLPIQAEIDADINLHLNELQASHVFHIAHEALANVARHARARQIQLSLIRKDGKVVLQVEDDGIGFDPPTTVEDGHHGLANIQKRVALLNATLNIDSTPNQGTRLSVMIPCNSNPSPPE